MSSLMESFNRQQQALKQMAFLANYVAVIDYRRRAAITVGGYDQSDNSGNQQQHGCMAKLFTTGHSAVVLSAARIRLSC